MQFSGFHPCQVSAFLMQLKSIAQYQVNYQYQSLSCHAREVFVYLHRFWLSHKPDHAFTGDRSRHRMRTIKFSIQHVIACSLQLRHNPATTPIDPQLRILCPVGNKTARSAHLGCGCHESGWKGNNVRKQITIGNADGKRIGCVIWEACDRNLIRSNGVLAECLC